ncbi:PIN domain-like protein [Mycena metata]|uniref:PIN domain-like protein n=1 Tax=Mycena metata TaxID=1033252 RepID=A0AAD7N7F0_9AGAR|nr:PIN domain-like protein [Mycena metata]
MPADTRHTPVSVPIANADTVPPIKADFEPRERDKITGARTPPFTLSSTCEWGPGLRRCLLHCSSASAIRGGEVFAPMRQGRRMSGMMIASTGSLGSPSGVQVSASVGSADSVPLPRTRTRCMPRRQEALTLLRPSSSSTMGVPEFWQLALKAAQTTSFDQLSAAETGNTRPLVIGVDAGLWMGQCQTVFHMPSHAQMGRNPELRALLWKLAALSRAGVIAVFVKDGPERPSVKRNKKVKAKPHWLVEEFTEMIEHFGFHSYTAPGEAEAELAYLNREGYVDAVLTDDGDTAIFGAQCIIRRKTKDELTVYTTDELKNNPNVGLTLGGILLVALLKGGDYDTVGLPGCGIGIAQGLAKGGYGDSLLAAVQNMTAEGLADFLVGWREEVRMELATNSKGHLKCKQKALSSKVPDTFPSLRVLNLYVHPTTSWSDGFFLPAVDRWTAKVPALPELALFCKRKFGWKTPDLTDRFKRLIFPGAFARRLTLPLDLNQHLYNHVVLGRVEDEHPALSAFLKIVGRKEVAPGVVLYRMEISIGGLIQWTVSRIDAPTAAGSASATSMQWIPAPFVERYFPLMVNKFNGTKASHSRARLRCMPFIFILYVQGLPLLALPPLPPPSVDIIDIPDSPVPEPAVF